MNEQFRKDSLKKAFSILLDEQAADMRRKNHLEEVKSQDTP